MCNCKLSIYCGSQLYLLHSSLGYHCLRLLEEQKYYPFTLAAKFSFSALLRSQERNGSHHLEGASNDLWKDVLEHKGLNSTESSVAFLHP